MSDQVYERGYDPLDMLNTAQRLVFACSRNRCSFIKGLAKAGVSRNQHSKWLKDKYYREAYRDFQLELESMVNDTVFDRINHGQRKPVIYQGVITDWYREYDNRLLWRVAQSVGQKEFRFAGKPENKVDIHIGTVDNRTQFINQVMEERKRRASITANVVDTDRQIDETETE